MLSLEENNWTAYPDRMEGVTWIGHATLQHTDARRCGRNQTVLHQEAGSCRDPIHESDKKRSMNIKETDRVIKT